MVTNILNALDRIPKLMEQYKSQNATIEKDLPTLREIVGGTWKKEEELKGLKSELSTIERKIQLELAPMEKNVSNSNDGTAQKQETTVVVTTTKKNEPLVKEYVPIVHQKPSARENSKGIKI